MNKFTFIKTKSDEIISFVSASKHFAFEHVYVDGDVLPTTTEQIMLQIMQIIYFY